MLLLISGATNIRNSEPVIYKVFVELDC